MFIWNGISSNDMDVITKKLPPISTSIPKSEDIEGEGIDGYLTLLGGYESDIKEVDAHYIGKDTIKLLNWLKGSGEIIFGNIADRYYKARINNKIPLEQIVTNKLYYFPIMFKCQPFSYLTDGKEEVTLVKPTTLFDERVTHTSKPIITIYGNGATMFSINNRNFNITNIDGSITINSDVKEVYSGKGRYMEGDFPILDIGENEISWTGNISKVEIIPNWRCLV